jgi:hypothetical protein
VIAIYAITDRPPAEMPVEPRLQRVKSAGLVAVCGPARDEPISAHLLWRHEEIVETLMKTCDLLPVRFGMHVNDESAVVGALKRQRRELVAALARVRGAVELSVRVAGEVREPCPAPAFVSGADYLRVKAQQAEADAELSARIHEPLTSLARASRRWSNFASDEPMRSAYLVERTVVRAFADRVSELQRANPEVRILCTGPWPPYSFVRE